MNIYIICPVHPFIGCGDLCGHYTHWNTSKFVLYKVICGMYWFAECHLFYETWSAGFNY